MAQEHADIIYSGGTILPLTGCDATLEAVAVKDGVILACGSRADVEKLAGPDTERVDLAGSTMLPGFYDAHSHFVEVGTGRLIYSNVNCPPYGPVERIQDVLDILREKAERTPKGKSVIGAGYDQNIIAEHRHLTRVDLDQVSTEHPVICDYVTSHFMYVNSMALRIAGIDRNTPDPQGGVIRRDEQGEPTGVLEETAVDLIWYKDELGFLGTRDEKIRGLKEATDYYAARGYTTANQGLVGDAEIMQEGEKQGYLGIRCTLWSAPEPAAKYAKENVKSEGNMFFMTGGKEFQDGSIGCGTAYLTKPYYTKLPDRSADYCGSPVWSREELTELVKKVHNAGAQMHIHCNGDAAIDDVLYAYEQAQLENPCPDPRHVVVHAQMSRMDQLEKMKELGVTPTFYVPTLYPNGDIFESTYLGPERCEHVDPIKTAMDMGLHPTVHTDCPVMPPDPLTSIWTAVTRKAKSGAVIGQTERLSVYEALLASTINAAYQSKQEDLVGTIEPGKWADFVVLDRNPLQVDADDIPNLKILKTIVGGRCVYQA